MDADELFDHALSSLPEAVGDLLRSHRDPAAYVFASFDGASELGRALIAADLQGDVGLDREGAQLQVDAMIQSANDRGEDLMISVMVTADVLARILVASKVDRPTRTAVDLWLDSPVEGGHFRVVAIAGEQIRAATVDTISEMDDEPVSSTLMN
jgi:hypothetical protein